MPSALLFKAEKMWMCGCYQHWNLSATKHGQGKYKKNITLDGIYAGLNSQCSVYVEAIDYHLSKCNVLIMTLIRCLLKFRLLAISD